MNLANGSYSFDIHLSHPGQVSCFPPSWIPHRAHNQGQLQWPMAWWPQYLLFTEMAMFSVHIWLAISLSFFTFSLLILCWGIVLYTTTTMLWSFQVNSEGTQPYTYVYPFSLKLPSHPGWLITLSLLVIHFKYSSVYMTFPNSLTVPSHQQP